MEGHFPNFSGRAVAPRLGLSRPRQPPLAARLIRGRPRPQDARLRSQQPDKEAGWARAPVLKSYVPPTAATTTEVTTTAATTTTTPTTTTKTTTTTVQLKSTQQLYFSGEKTEPELQWYPIEKEKVKELQNYKHESLSWKNEILPSPQPLKLYQKNNDPINVSPENIIDLTSTLKSGVVCFLSYLLSLSLYFIDLIHCEFSKHDLEMSETNRQIITTICQGSISSSS